MRLLLVVDGFAHHTHIHPYEGICGRQLVPFLAFSFVLLLLLSSGYRAVTGSITFFLCSLKNRLFFGGGGVIKRVKLLRRQSSVPCYEM